MVAIATSGFILGVTLPAAGRTMHINADADDQILRPFPGTMQCTPVDRCWVESGYQNRQLVMSASRAKTDLVSKNQVLNDAPYTRSSAFVGWGFLHDLAPATVLAASP
jgi:hypothetical protein